MPTDTNHNPGNEEWLFEAIVQLERMGLLKLFCSHIGIQIGTSQRLIAEVVWPAVRERYQTEDGNFDVSAACRHMLAFPPFAEAAAKHIRDI